MCVEEKKKDSQTELVFFSVIMQTEICLDSVVNRNSFSVDRSFIVSDYLFI